MNTTPPPSPYSPSPPVTPRSPHPLLLQPANRASISPSRSSTYPTSHHPLSPLPPSPMYRPTPESPSRKSSPYHHHIDVGRANGPPPNRPLPPLVHTPSYHQRVGSKVPRYTLKDVVVSQPPTLGYHQHSQSTTTFNTDLDYDSDTKQIVTKEGFLEDEVKPIRGFWARWTRGMIILLIFLGIAVGVAIGVSEYYDSKHGGGEKNSLEDQTTTSSTLSGSTTSVGSFIDGSTSIMDSLVATTSLTSDTITSRMRTVRTTSTHSSPTSNPVRDTTTSSPTQATSEDLTLSSDTSTPDETTTSSPSRETVSIDSNETETEEPTSAEEVTQTDRGRVLGLASATSS